MIDKFVPESVLKRLVVGQRVRYVPDVECNRQIQVGSVAHRYGASAHESYFEAEHKTGTIISTSDTRSAGHPYIVTMDVKYRFGGQEWEGVVVAAHELALVED